MRIFAETTRFILREFLTSDAEALFALDSDPEVMKYLGNRTLQHISQAEAVVKSVQSQYENYGIGRWAVIDKTSGEFVGWSGLKFVTEVTNGHQHYHDLGYRLLRKHWGKGVATETSLASLDYAFRVLKLDTLYATAHTENVASNKVLTKIGFTCSEAFEYETFRCNWYSLTVVDYSASLDK